MVAPILMFVLIPMLAVTLDVGRLFVSRSAQQNAADQAARAAAWASCYNGSSASAAIAAGTASATRNGFTAGGTTPMGRVVGVSVVDRGSGSWGATIDVDVDGAFSKVVGVATSRVSTRASASCHAGASDAARIHANSSTCHDTFEWSGSNINLVGVIHSNNALVISGSNLTNTGATTYVGVKTETGSNHKWLTMTGAATTPTKVTSTKPMPVTYSIADFAPGGAVARDTRYVYVAAPHNQQITVAWLKSKGYLTGTTLTPGIYYTDVGISLSGQNITGTATFVARDVVTVDAGTAAGASIKITAYYNNLALFTNKNSKAVDTPTSGDCDYDAMWLRSNVEINGLAYVPWAKFNMPGDKAAVKGGLVANQMDLGGTNLTLGGGPGGASTGSPSVDLDDW
jgi:putative Flp pilus-assembly TadE/G-like protein